MGPLQPLIDPPRWCCCCHYDSRMQLPHSALNRTVLAAGQLSHWTIMRLGNGLGTRDDDQGQPCARLAVAAGRALLPAAAAAAAAAPQRPLAPAAAGLQGHCWRLGAGAGAGRAGQCWLCAIAYVNSKSLWLAPYQLLNAFTTHAPTPALLCMNTACDCRSCRATNIMIRRHLPARIAVGSRLG